jgi:hypothetical protein
MHIVLTTPVFFGISFGIGVFLLTLWLYGNIILLAFVHSILLELKTGGNPLPQ